jgi:alkylhydroperoxidase/carboxymuconolactone decarboxylase family protein YurZ
MSTENHTEFSVNGLVIFDLNDLPEVTVTNDKISAGETVISRTGARLSYDELRNRSQELYAIALKVRDLGTAPELGQMMAMIEANTDHSAEEIREIALQMVKNGVHLGV